MAVETATTTENRVLILRTCDKNLKSHGGFQWPDSGPVACPDWSPCPMCGYGLHGFFWGEGNGSLADWSEDAAWLVVSVDLAAIVDLGGKVKYPAGIVIDIPKDRLTATNYIRNNGGEHRLIVGSTIAGGDRSTITGGYGSTITGGDGSTITGGYDSTITGGDGSTITGGYGSTITGGYGSTITGGYGSTITGGYDSTITGGDRSTITGGDGSTITGGDGSTITGGDGSTITGGDGSTITGGYGSTITGGDRSTITGGYGSTITGGDRSTITGGYGSTIFISWWDSPKRRMRAVVVYVGEDGIIPNVPYRVIDGRMVAVETQL